MPELQDPQKEPSPWLDPRALGASALFHALILVFAAVAVVGVKAPRPSATPRVLSAELGPVDDRVPSESGGGAPGPAGGRGREVSVIVDPSMQAGRLARNPADALLSTRDPASADPISSPLPPLSGPPTTGLLTNDIHGGGGGIGGGLGGGTGKGMGPGTEFFGATDRASSFAYVIDCSGSMSNRDALRIAKAELLASLERLPPDARFGVVFYNVRPTILLDEQGQPQLMPATQENKERLRARLTSIRPDGGTDHVRALKAAFSLKPEAIFFLTDAERMEGTDAETLTREAGPIRIQAIEFGDGPDTGGTSPLRDLATATGGSFRYLDLSARKPERPNPSPAR
jgi:hypothetical protein